MKKLLLTLFLVAATLSAKALTATIYVKATKAPYLYGWYTIGKTETKINGAWPGTQLTDSIVKTNLQGEPITFWYKTFEIEATSFNIIFNNGNTSLMKQTGNISNIASDRYFTYDGANNYTDITDEFGVDVPDVEIQSVALISELNGWDGLAQLFTEVEKDRKYTYNLSLTDTQLEPVEYYYRFKLMVNSSAYLDWNTEGMTRVDPNGWLEEDLGLGGGNIGILIDDVEGAPHNILFTLEFAGGKDIYQGWTLTVGEGSANINAIQVVDASKAKPYNLSGQRVNANYRGLVIQNGKKVMK